MFIRMIKYSCKNTDRRSRYRKKVLVVQKWAKMSLWRPPSAVASLRSRRSAVVSWSRRLVRRVPRGRPRGRGRSHLRCRLCLIESLDARLQCAQPVLWGLRPAHIQSVHAAQRAACGEPKAYETMRRPRADARSDSSVGGRRCGRRPWGGGTCHGSQQGEMGVRDLHSGKVYAKVATKNEKKERKYSRKESIAHSFVGKGHCHLATEDGDAVELGHGALGILQSVSKGSANPHCYAQQVLRMSQMRCHATRPCAAPVYATVDRRSTECQPARTA